MAYALLLSRQAEKYLADLHRPDRERLERALWLISENPRGRNSFALVADRSGFMKKRIGRWRIVYRIDDKSRQVQITIIDDRKQVYRRR